MDLTIAEQVDYGHPVWPALRLDLPSVHARAHLLGESSDAKGMNSGQRDVPWNRARIYIYMCMQWVFSLYFFLKCTVVDRGVSIYI